MLVPVFPEVGVTVSHEAVFFAVHASTPPELLRVKDCAGGLAPPTGAVYDSELAEDDIVSELLTSELTVMLVKVMTWFDVSRATMPLGKTLSVTEISEFPSTSAVIAEPLNSSSKVWKLAVSKVKLAWPRRVNPESMFQATVRYSLISFSFGYSQRA